MKLLYITTHPIHNLIPLYRELNKKKDINFVSINWINVPQNHYDYDFGKIINFKVDYNVGYQNQYLINNKKDIDNFNNHKWILIKLKIIFKLTKLILCKKFDIIIFHQYLYPNIIGAIFAKMIGKKTVMRSISYNLGKRNFFKVCLRYLYYRFSNIFIDDYWAVHVLNEEFFLSHGAKKKNIYLIDHGQSDHKHLISNNPNLLLSNNEFCNKYNLPKNKKFILFAAKFIKKKNPKILLESFHQANLDNNWFLLMVGNGKLENEIKEYVKINKITNIKFFDFLDQEKLISFFHNSEILALPSGVGETHGNIITEAIQFGCALLLSNKVGLNLECTREEMGLVFDIDNKEQLTKNLELICQNKNLLKKFQANALEYGKKKTPVHAANLIMKYLKL